MRTKADFTVQFHLTFHLLSIYLGINMNTRGSDFLSWRQESQDVKGCSLTVKMGNFTEPCKILISLLYNMIVLLRVPHMQEAHKDSIENL